MTSDKVMRLGNHISCVALVAVLLSFSVALSIAGTASAPPPGFVKIKATVTTDGGGVWEVQAQAIGEPLSGTATIREGPITMAFSDLTGSIIPGGSFDSSFTCDSSDTFVVLEGTVTASSASGRIGQPIVIVACDLTNIVGLCPIGLTAEQCRELNSFAGGFPPGAMATGTGMVIVIG